MAYPLDTEVQLTGTFTSATGVATDPTTITLYILEPGQVNSTAYTYAASQLTRASTGVYTYNLLLNKAGTWTYGWVGTGTVEAATFDIPLIVQPSILHS